MKYLRAALSLLFAGGLTFMLNRPLGPVPALGPFFSPFTGFWQNAEKPVNTPPSDIKLQGLKGEVTVQYDDNHVPHIFADNDEDLYFAQGYVLAKDRLWQMDFYSRVAAGRLSEALGPLALEFDQYNRRLQLPEGAEKVLEVCLKDPISKMITESYAAGVNAYISQLTYKDLAIEYKLLGYQPEPWTPLKTALVEQVMKKDMNGRSDDYRMSNMLAKYGKEVMDDLFPNYPSEESPVIPSGTKWDFKPLAVPKIPELMQATLAAHLNLESENPGIGSNNWAVHGSRTATGLPILANDPHLGLTLPSIWYQVQLVSPTVNVYGVCVPGWPGVGIGFNKDAAWGITNVGSDVFDLYQIKFKDKTQKEYWYNNGWKPTIVKVETYAVKGLPEAVKDTVYYTHHGAVLYNEGKKSFSKEIPVGHAARWSGLFTGNSLLALYHGNRAKNYDEYRVFYQPETLGGPFKALSPFRGGNFEMSFMSFKTAFARIDGNYNSPVFEQFKANIDPIRKRLDALQLQDPNYKAEYDKQIARNPEFKAARYDSTSQDVLIRAFFAAYNGKDPEKVTLNPFLSFPLPNWRVDYGGLSQLKAFKKIFSSFTIEHSYQSTYRVGNFTSALNYNELFLNLAVRNYPTAVFTNDLNQFIPVFAISTISLSEKFAPLIGIRARTVSRIDVALSYNQDRDVILSPSTSQVAETFNRDITTTIGFTKNNVRIPFRINGKFPRLKNDLQARCTLTFRESLAILRRLNDVPAAKSGQINFQLRPQVNYTVSKLWSIMLYFDRSFNDVLVLNTIPRARTSGGIQVRFNVAEL
ncbi:MAG: cell surface protein SprA [Runella slithyformis]|nr:MAG: cell surface protein SprA [Runella slithyformis]